MSRIEMSDDDWFFFQGEFYNLIEKYGVSEVTCDHPEWDRICELRNMVAEFIEEEKYNKLHGSD
tara:strand:+ start:369 stop:560 length:192 start_codon:yes stop_codon:yes gene_type:complete